MSNPELSQPSSRAGTALRWSGGFVGVLWVIEFLDLLMAQRLDRLGIEPLTIDGLWGIAFAPVLHSGWAHLVSNTVPLLVLGFVLLLSGLRRSLGAVAIIWVVSGAGTWLFGGINTLHIGASGVVFGLVTFLVARGFFSRNLVQLGAGFLVLLTYGGVLWGVLPGQPGVSWQAHLFGAIGGVIAASVLAKRP